MRKRLPNVLALLSIFISSMVFAQQADFTGLSNGDAMCIGSGTTTLTATNNSNGAFSGPGVSNTSAGVGAFNPVLAGPGSKSISYTANIADSWSVISNGSMHTMAIKADGTLWAWGYNGNGQLGTGNYNQQTSPVQIGSDTWTAVAAGPNFSVGIKSNGTMWAWGYGNNGQLGNGGNSSSITHVQVGSATDWSSIALGDNYCMAIKSDGTLWGWGGDGYGQLGNGGYFDRNTPVQVGTATDWSKVDCGNYHTLAIKTNGTLWGWGYNYEYSVGTGYGTQGTPIQVGSDSDWSQVSAGGYASMAIKTSGALWGWGYNYSYNLGNGSSGSQSFPVQIGTATNWAKVCLGSDGGIGIRTNGTLWAWGSNGSGQAGNGTTTQLNVQTQIGTATNWSDVSMTGASSCVKKTSGNIYFSGNNGYGQLGDGTTTARTSHTLLGTTVTATIAVTVNADNAAFTYSGSVLHFTTDTDPVPTITGLAGGTFTTSSPNLVIDPATGEVDIASSAIGNYTVTYTTNGSCPNTKTVNFYLSAPINADYTGVDDSDTLCIGDPAVTLTATNITTGTFSGNGVSNVSAGAGSFNPAVAGAGNHTVSYTISNSGLWTSVAVANVHTLAIKENGTLWAWGNNSNGLLGIGNQTQQTSPVQVGTATWTTVACGSNNSAGIRTDGTLWAWGYGGNGQLGNGGTSSQVPLQVGSANNWVQVSVGDSYTMALKADGTLWVFGYTNYGIGNGTTQYYYPTQVGTATDWRFIEAGGMSLFAIKTNGTLWACGYNGYGQFGNGTTSTSNTNFLQIGSATDWSKVINYNNHTLAIKTDGTLWATGNNGNGQLGIGNTNQQNTFVQVGTATNWVSIAAGDYHSLATKADGTLWAWGNNGSGQFGNGTTTQTLTPVQIGTASHWANVLGGSSYTFVHHQMGYLWYSGTDGNGQLGNGTAGSTTSLTVLGTPMVSSKTVTVNADNPAFAYSGSLLHFTTDTNPIPTITGLAGGTFTTSSPDLAIDAATGEVLLDSSIAGTYTITYTTNGPCPFSKTINFYLSNPINANYSGIATGDTVCIGDPAITLTADNIFTGTFTGSAVSTISAGVGSFNPAVAGAGNHTVTYTIQSAQLWTTMSLGNSYALAIKENGTLWGWGNNSNYQLGIGNTTQQNTAVQIGTATWKAVAAGNNHSAAIKTDGTLWAWGFGGNYQLGNGGATATTPVQIGSASNWVQVSVGDQYTLALKADGTIWVVGYNQFGIGNGTTQYSSLVQIGSATDWKFIEAGSNSLFAIKNNGTLWACGYNQYGQFGNGSNNQYNYNFVQVGTATDWAKVSNYSLYTLGLKTNGTLWVTGNNGNGQLGTGNYNTYYTFTQNGTATNWATIAAGENHAMATKTDGTLWAWGINNSGQYGNGTTTTLLTPTQIGTATHWTNAWANAYFSTAQDQIGYLYVTGNNSSGLMGNGTTVSGTSLVTLASPVVSNQVIHVKADDATFAYSGSALHFTTDPNPVPVITGLAGGIFTSSSPNLVIDSITGEVNIDSSLVGNYTITYTTNGPCPFSKTIGFFLSLPVNADFTGLMTGDTMCVTAAAVTLNATNITTGTFSGPGVSNTSAGIGSFDPAGSGVGDHPVSYTINTPQLWNTMSLGSSYTLAIKENGTLWGWGYNGNGQLGTGNTTQQSSPVQVGTANWTTVAAGNIHSAGIRADGTLWTWGHNGNYQLGTGNTTMSNIPVQIGTATNWTQVSVGDQYTMALKADGTLWIFGQNNNGLGNGTTQYTTPTQMGTATDWKFIEAGGTTLFAIKHNGTLWACGNNNNGQFGNGTGGNFTTFVQVGTATDWAKISNNSSHTLALKTNGTLWAAGANGNYQLGTGNTSQQLTFVQIGTAADWATIAAGADYSMATRTDGTLWGWGYNGNGQFGNGSTGQSTTPSQIGTGTNWTHVWVGSYFTAVRHLIGYISLTGNGSSGQQGNGTTNQVYTLTQLNTPMTSTVTATVITDNASFAYPTTLYFTNSANPVPAITGLAGGTFTSAPAGLTIDSLTGQIDIATSATGSYTITYTTNGSCPNAMNTNIVLSKPVDAEFTGITDDTTFCYAAAPDTLTATNITTGSFSGPGVTNLSAGIATFDPAAAGTGTHTIEYTIDAEGTWKEVATGLTHTLAIHMDGTLWAWGNNNYGQLGNGGTGNAGSPMQIGTASNWSKIAAGNSHSMAVKTDGTLWAWGNNGNGQLGNGGTGTSLTPVQVGTSSNWKDVSCGDLHTIALKTNGTLWGWGYNNVGQLGNGSTTQSLIPVQIGTATNWSKIETGSSFSMAIRTNGTLWAWGDNGNYQLGDGTNAVRTAPVQIGTATNWMSVSAGSAHVLAVKTNGTLWAWGNNGNGQLGTGTGSNLTVPTQIGNASNWKMAVTSTGNYMMGMFSKGVRTDGTLWAWGLNNNGQYGNGTTNQSSIPVQIGTETNWTRVFCGEQYSIQMKSDYSIWSTGTNSSGQLGLGSMGGAFYTPVKVVVTEEVTSEITVSVTVLDNTSFAYDDAAYCINANDPVPVIAGVNGGAFSAPAGLLIDTITGAIDLDASAPGIYTVTYSTEGACANSSSVSFGIKETSTGSETISACQSYTWAANNQTYTTSGTYTANLTNAVGCDSVVTLSLFIGDTIAPAITCPANITLNNLAGNCGRSVNYAMPLVADNCSTILTQTDGTSLTSGNLFPIGTTNQEYLVTDLGGNTATCAFTVTIIDAQAPLITNCPANRTVSAAANSCSAVVSWAPPVASDNCSGVLFTSTHAPGATFNTGAPTTVTYTATDVNGNTATCSFTVTVTDDVAPATPVLATISEQCSATVAAPTTTDNCAGTITGTTTDPLAYAAEGTYVIHWTFTDGNGNTTTANQMVIVNDNTAPAAPFLATINSQCPVTLTAPTAPDNCAGTITGTTASSLIYSAEGTYSVVWTFNDGNGNTSYANQTVIIDDNTAPAMPTLATLTGQCSVTATAPTTTDNCAGTITGTTTDPLTYSADGTYTIHWTFNDGNGNTTTANQTVIVNDVTAPAMPTLATLTGQCTVTATAPTTTDNCAGTITGTTTDPVTYSADGTYTIHWTFNDGRGNTTTANQTVIVDDVTAPATPTLATLTGQCTVTATAPTTTDNCGGVITGTTASPLTYTTEGTYTIVWSFNDGRGNTTTANQTVIVDDVTAPVTPALATLTGQCSVTATAPTTTDNCGGIITGTTANPLTYTTEGTYTIVWTFTDGRGNTTTANQTVIVDDVTAPVAPFLATVTGQCSVTLTAPTAPDNCAGTITGTTASPLTYTTEGTYSVVWAFNDGRGNTSFANQTVIIDDNTAPATPTLATLTGQCSVTATAPTTTDNCAGTITGTTTDPLTYAGDGTYTIHWTFNDGRGNTTTANQTVIVNDVTAPVTPTLATLTGQCSVTATAPTTTDNCAGTITGTTTDPLTYAGDGTYTIHWTFNDGRGNTTTANQTVIVNDVTAPATPTLATLTGQCSVTVTAPTTTDNCAGTITGTTASPLIYTTEGTYTIQWTFNDGNGNTTTANQTVIVDDVTAPATPTLATLTGQCSVTATAPTTTDNCSGTITGTTASPLTYTTEGTYTIQWTFNDGHGNTTTTNQTVIVDDVTAPATPTLATLTGQCSVTAAAVTTTDNCAGTITGTTTDPLTYTTQGTHTIHWSFSDGNGNTTTANQTVIVDDVTAPVAPFLATVTGQCSVTLTAPTAPDNCAGTITGTTASPLTYATEGTYSVVWAFNDGNGNTSFANQTVIIDDNVAPVTPTLATLTGQCSVTATAPTTTDDCSGTITGTTASPLSYTTEGTYTIQWTFNDGHGNTTTANQTVIVDDNIAPVTPTLATLTGQCSVTATAPTTTDNCSGTITGTTASPLSYTTEGTYTIQWTFNDGHGNTTTANQTVIVDDNIAPAMPTLATLTGQCSVTATAPTTTDNCSGTITGTTANPLSYTTEGTYTIQWTFNDGHGNMTTANQTVIVDDNTAPVAPFLATINGQCSVTLTAPTTTDNCAGTITGTTTDPMTYSTEGVYAVVWTFNDGNGNSSFANQLVIVNDNTAPVVPVLATLTGECSVTATAPTTTDNCAGTITGTTQDPVTYSTQGTHVIHWTFNDGNGNTSTAEQTVVINDTTAPAAMVLATVTSDCSMQLTAPATTDNCSGTITGTTSDPTTYSAQGTYAVLWTFTDANGNTSTATQLVVIEDTIAPAIPVLATVSGMCELTASVPTTTDNCSGTITGTTTTVFPITEMGTTTVTWTFEDANGNVSTATQDYVLNTVEATTTLVDAVTISANNSDATAYQWFDCSTSTEIAGATGQTFTATANGNYSVIVSYNGCSDTSDCVTISEVGMAETLQVALSLYPNPTATGVFTVSYNGEVTGITLYDMSGRLIASSYDALTHQVTMPAVERGKYIVYIATESGTIAKPIEVMN